MALTEEDMFKMQMAGQLAGAFGNKQGYLTPNQTHQGSILVLTNPENELYKLELSLRNMRLDQEGNPIKIANNALPLMNDFGINSVLGQIQALVNQVTVVSNFEDRHIQGLMDYLGDTLARDLMMNQTNYEIKNGYDRDRIFFQCLSTAFVTMMRAKDEGERRFWKGTQQEIMTTINGAKPSGKNWMNKLLSGSFK